MEVFGFHEGYFYVSSVKALFPYKLGYLGFHGGSCHLLVTSTLPSIEDASHCHGEGCFASSMEFCNYVDRSEYDFHGWAKGKRGGGQS